MKLIFIYGAPATGKLTIALVLAKRTGYKVFHNHLSADFAASLFPWDHPERKRLAEKFRLDMFESAAKNNINIIFTFASVGDECNTFVSKMIQSIEAHGGTVYFIKLICKETELYKRVTNSSRTLYKKISTVQDLKAKLKKVDFSQIFSQKPSLIIDTTEQSPNKSVEQIISYLSH